MAPDYDHLTLMEKVEVFEHAVNNTAGDDLAKLLWLKSPSSEVCVCVAVCLCLCVCHRSKLPVAAAAGLVRPEDQLHSISGRHVHGGLHPGPGRQVSQSLGPGEHLLSHPVTRRSAEPFPLSDSPGIRPT